MQIINLESGIVEDVSMIEGAMRIDSGHYVLADESKQRIRDFINVELPAIREKEAARRKDVRWIDGEANEQNRVAGLPYIAKNGHHVTPGELDEIDRMGE